MKKISVAQIGSRMHYAVPLILYKNNMLKYLYTDLSATGGLGCVLRLLSLLNKSTLLKKIANRRPNSLPSKYIRAQNILGIKKWFFSHYKNKFKHGRIRN